MYSFPYRYYQTIHLNVIRNSPIFPQIPQYVITLFRNTESFIIRILKMLVCMLLLETRSGPLVMSDLTNGEKKKNLFVKFGTRGGQDLVFSNKIKKDHKQEE